MLLSTGEEIDCSSVTMDILENSFSKVSADGYKLRPGNYVVGRSFEKVRLSSRYGGRILNCNSLTLIGLNCAISSFINPGYNSNVPIVIHNFGKNTIVLHSRMRICQLEIHFLGEEAFRNYKERDDKDKILELVENLSKKDFIDNGKHVDNTLSNFLDKKISEMVSRV